MPAVERRRGPVARFGWWLYRFFIGPFEEKRDELRRGSMTRWIAFLFALGYLGYLARVEALNWPGAFLGFCVLFALGIAKAIDSAPPLEVVQAVTGMAGRGEAPASSSWFPSTTTAGSAPVPPPDAPGVLGVEDLLPPVTGGRPMDDDPAAPAAESGGAP